MREQNARVDPVEARVDAEDVERLRRLEAVIRDDLHYDPEGLANADALARVLASIPVPTEEARDIP
jgi:hypothetical protein